MQVNLNMNNIWTTLDFGIMGQKKTKKLIKTQSGPHFFHHNHYV